MAVKCNLSLLMGREKYQIKDCGVEELIKVENDNGKK